MSELTINGRFLTQQTTGVQRYASEMAGQLIARYPSAEVVHPSRIMHPEMAKKLHARSLGKLSGYAWEQVSLPRGLRSRGGNPFLINLANVGPVAYTNSLLVLHDIGFLRHPEWYNRVFATTYRLLIPRLVKTYRQIVTDSEFSRQELASVMGISPESIAVVPCGVSDQFSPGDSELSTKDGPYILAVSSLDPKKNFDRLVEAFASLQLYDVRLVCVGGHHRVFAGRGAVAKRNMTNVHFTGYVTDEQLINLYRGASLFVYPSLYEGFGLPPLEAMACGCPCVVSRAGALPEVCGDAAAYCNPENTGDIADVMKMVLGDQSLRNQLISRGRIRANRFSWQSAGDKMASVLENIL